MRYLGIIFLLAVVACSKTTELPEVVEESILLRGLWELKERTVIIGNDVEDCNVSGLTMEFLKSDRVVRSHQLDCDDIVETGNYLYGNLRTIVFSSYVIDVQEFELTESRLSFEYPTNLDDTPPLERVREVYIKKP